MNKLLKYIGQPVHIAPLITFRVLFGFIMSVSLVRFMLKGWVTDLYIMPDYFFTYLGFEWVKPLGEFGMYALFGFMLATTLAIMLGYFYKVAIIGFFICFTYVELIDKSNYLNHYYFISLVSFLLIWLPAHLYFSLDVLRKPAIKRPEVPRWNIDVIKLQLIVVYVFAGLAKINSDWLLEAMPLKIWLHGSSNLPVIGPFMNETWVAYAFSWGGCLYDLTIPFFLLNRKTRPYAFVAVIIFHALTKLFLPVIGMFPYIMILSTLIFFSGDFHRNLLERFKSWFGGVIQQGADDSDSQQEYTFYPVYRKALLGMLGIFFFLQVLVPMRYLLYPGNLFWTEQGYRFSWRVMLMEKAGTVFFYVSDPETGQKTEVTNCNYLTPFQEKMMATQPDMILQFAHFLRNKYKDQGIENPAVRVESYVTLNGSGSRPFIDPDVNLAAQSRELGHKDWIIAY